MADVMNDVLMDLQSAAGGHCAEASSGDAVAGVPARWVARPGTTQETSAVMRVAATNGLSVVAARGRHQAPLGLTAGVARPHSRHDRDGRGG